MPQKHLLTGTLVIQVGNTKQLTIINILPMNHAEFICTLANNALFTKNLN